MSIYEHEIKAVIFDNDGTILDTVPLFLRVMEKLSNMKFTPELHQEINGRCDIDVAGIMAKRFHQGMSAEEYLAKRDEIVYKEIPNCGIVAGMKEIVLKLHEMGIPMAVGTSADRETFNIKIANHKEFYKNMAVHVTKDDVENAKPSPDIFLKAMEKLGDFKPENCLVFEDAGNGALAAQKAGMPCVLLNGAGDPNIIENLKKIGCNPPTLILNSFTEFDFNMFKFK